jgi:hypothetical protein
MVMARLRPGDRRPGGMEALIRWGTPAGDDYAAGPAGGAGERQHRAV